MATPSRYKHSSAPQLGRRACVRLHPVVRMRCSGWNRVAHHRHSCRLRQWLLFLHPSPIEIVNRSQCRSVHGCTHIPTRTPGIPQPQVEAEVVVVRIGVATSMERWTWKEAPVCVLVLALVQGHRFRLRVRHLRPCYSTGTNSSSGIANMIMIISMTTTESVNMSTGMSANRTESKCRHLLVPVMVQVPARVLTRQY
jgi:hypothetical protein